jgi:hypothetical protein
MLATDMHTPHCASNYTIGVRCSCGGDVTTLTVEQLHAEVRRLRAIVRRAGAALRGELERAP